MTPAAPIPASRVAILDPLRGVAALAVLWFHLTNGGGLFADGSQLSRSLLASGQYGWTGVEMFFVISGFVLPYALERGGYRLRDYGTFWMKRLLRLEPPYLASIALVLVLWALSTMAPSYLGAPFALEPRRLLLHLGYLNHYFGAESYNPVYWTLAIELQFYLSIALLFPLLAARRELGRILAPVTLLAFAWIPLDGIFLFKYLPLFVLGMLVYQHHARVLSTVGFVTLAVLALVAALLRLGPLVTTVGGLTAASIAAFSTWNVIPNLHQRAWVRALAWAGVVSYSLYLVHVPVGGRVVNFGARFAVTGIAKVGVLLLAAAASLAGAWALHRLVERPSQRLSAGLRFRGRP